MKYRLNINFTEQDLKSIYDSRQKVVIIKQTEIPAEIAVAWVCFHPFMKNCIEWDSDYMLYASTSKIEDVTIINKLYEENVLPSTLYSFTDGPFNSPQKTTVYYADNCSEDFSQITLGLAQNIVVNGDLFENLPVNAFYVPSKQSINIIPGEHISVLLQKNIVSSMMLTFDPKNMQLDFNELQTEYTLNYDGKTNKFSIEE